MHSSEQFNKIEENSLLQTPRLILFVIELEMRRKNYNFQTNTQMPSIQPTSYTPVSLLSQHSPISSRIKTETSPNPYFHQENANPLQKETSQLDKMESLLGEVYNRRKMKNLQRRTPQTISGSSLTLGESNLRLPLLNGSQAEEESQLMNEIRKMQAKIRELRHERNLVGNQQDRYQILRPLVEMQNQNMMNMQQMMLMMAQQNNQPHHCCPQTQIVPICNHHSRTKVGYRQDSATPSEDQDSEDERKPIKKHRSNKNKKKQPQKTYNMRKLRKFRVAAIAVYFSLLFPRYSNRFTRKRFQLHSQHYFNIQTSQSQIGEIFFEEISGVNCYSVAKRVEEFRREKEVRRVAKTKTAKLVISEQYGGQKSYEIYIGDIEIFLLEFLKELLNLLQNGGIQQTLSSIQTSSLPQSFPIDLTHLLQQLYRLTYHPKKLYLKITSAQSQALILSQFFVKLLIFDYLFVIREDTQWKKRLLKDNGLKKDQMIEAEMVATEMYISGVLLHRYCMQILQEMIEGQEGNIEQLDIKNIPIPLEVIAYDGGDDQEKEEGSIKVFNRFQKLKEAGSNPLSLQKYSSVKIYKFEYIKNLQQFDSLVDQIEKKSGQKTEVKDTIMDILDLVCQKVQKKRQEEYARLKADLLMEEKHLVTRKNSENNSYELSKRNPKEQKYLRQMVKLIKENRIKEASGETSESEEVQEEQQEEESENSKQSSIKAASKNKKK